MNFYDAALAIWKSGAPVKSTGNIDFLLPAHKRILTFFQAGNSYCYIFNLNKGAFEYVSGELREVLGYDPDTLTVPDLMEKIHPDDRSYFISFEQQALNFMENIPTDKIGSYKVQYDFRIRNAYGNYRQILHQCIVIDYKDSRNLLRSFCIHSDISHIKQGGAPSLSFLGMNGEPSYYNVEPGKDVNAPSKELFTQREREILRSIVEGCSSKQIASDMFLSIHTVHTHRKNLMRKSKCRSLADLVNKAVLNAWI